MNEIIIYNYLSGHATAEEKKQLFDWLQASETNRTLFCEIKAIWQARRLTDPVRAPHHPPLKQSLAQLNRRIDALSTPAAPRTLGKYVFLHLAAAAVVLVVIISIYTSLTQKKYPAGHDDEWICYIHPIDSNEVATFYLPDSTQVWLDKATRLEYPKQFTGDIREVNLEGTAFFEVRKDATHPFIVHTPTCKIKVLGTAFSIHTRTPSQEARTILMNGSVQLLDLADEPMAQLRPGQEATFSPYDKSVEIREVDASAMTSWRFGLTTLTDLSAGELVRALETLYAIRIDIDTASLAGRHYHFTFKRSNKPEAIVRQLAYITGKPARIRAPRP